MIHPIAFPVLVFYDDYSIGLHPDQDDFFRTSGCKEFDFYDVLTVIIDCKGYVLKIDGDAPNAELRTTGKQ